LAPSAALARPTLPSAGTGVLERARSLSGEITDCPQEHPARRQGERVNRRASEKTEYASVRSRISKTLPFRRGCTFANPIRTASEGVERGAFGSTRRGGCTTLGPACSYRQLPHFVLPATRPRRWRTAGRSPPRPSRPIWKAAARH